MPSKIKIYFTSLLLAFSIGSLNAQSVIMTGAVYSPDQEPLEMANVIAYSLKDSTISTFAITDFEGQYKLELQQDSSYMIKVVYLGYQDHTEVLEVKGELSFKTLVLKSAVQDLNEVTVVYKVPVTIKGDTISFNTEAFTTGNEKKLKDVFEKLPGFDVDDSGSIKVNGQNVDKITVDGKEFFTGDTKLAGNNIPADVVDKVNVLRNHSDVAQMRAFDGGDGLAIDISLKGDKQNILFGSVEAGAGLDDRYLGHTGLFYFNPKLSLNFIGNANNVSEQVFTMQDVMRFNGGLGGMHNKNGASTRLSTESLGMVSLKDNKARNTDTKIAALNFTFSPNKKWNFSGFGILSDIGTEVLNESNRTYIGLQGATTNNELLSSNTMRTTTSGIFKLQSKYTPNAALHVEHQFMAKRMELGVSQFLQSDNTLNNRNFRSSDISSMPSIEQHLDLYYAFNPKHLITLNWNQLYNAKRTAFQLGAKDPNFTTIIPTVLADTLSLNQAVRLNTHKLDGALAYYYLINAKNHIGVTAGFSNNDQLLTSGLSYENEAGLSTPFQESDWNNDLDYRFTDVFAGIHYKSKVGKFTIKPGLFAHRFFIDQRQAGSITSWSKDMLLPSLNVVYAMKKSTNLTLDYKIQTEFFDATKYATGKILRNYNEVYFGSDDLINSWYHNATLNFYNINLYSFTNMYGVLSYQKKYDNLNNRVIYDDLTRIGNPLNIAQPNDHLSLFLSIDKRFKKFKAALNANLGYGEFVNVLEDRQEVLNVSFTQQYKASVETTLDNFPALEVGLLARVNQYKSEQLPTQRYNTLRPFANLEVSFFKHFILVVDYEYNKYENVSGETSSDYDILNAELYFKKGDSPFEIKIAGLNLLNTAAIRQDAFSDVLISTSAYFIQPRYFLGTLKYEF